MTTTLWTSSSSDPAADADARAARVLDGPTARFVVPAFLAGRAPPRVAPDDVIRDDARGPDEDARGSATRGAARAAVDACADVMVKMMMSTTSSSCPASAS